MAMTRKQKRLTVIAGAGLVLAAAVAMVLVAFNQKIVFFVTPSDITAEQVQAGQRLRLGGMVEDGTVKRGEGVKVEFGVTDTLKTVPVHYEGILPDLFREGQGVVTEGVMGANGVFIADTVLAKHDENYMPKEVAESLQEKGVKLGKGAGEAAAN